MYPKRQFLSLCLAFISTMAWAASTPTILEVKTKTIEVNGHSKVVYTITQPDGTWGYVGTEGQEFNVIVKNETTVPTSIHWHGLILPNAMDGVPGVTQTPIPPGGEYHYQYPLVQAGTFWMHAHMGLQTQDLMEAPFIINAPNDPYKADQQVVVMFQDFSFKNPEAILKQLQSQKNTMPSMKMNMAMPTKPDLNDVSYDAFLTNYYSLKNPEIVPVKAGETVRLRFIDGAAASNFWIHLGKLNGTAIAFDGEDIRPIESHTFQLAMAQRIDVLVTIPLKGGAFPILGQVEGLNQQTGLILATPDALIPTVSENATTIAPAINDQQERVMKSLHPLPKKPINQIITLNLSGNMQKYIWMINGQVWPHITPIQVKEGTRVEIIFNNESGMSHPMHLHGNVFELVSINRQKISDGALHDTILVMPHSTVKVIFDADHPGKWVLHCHNAYHQAAGMMTYINVSGS